MINWENIPEEFVIFDLETTGLDAEYCEIIEIGALKFNKTNYLKDGQVDTFQTFVKPQRKIPSEITAINSITNEMVETGSTLKEAVESLFTFAGKNKFVAYNAKFDVKFIRNAAKKVDFKLPRPFAVDCANELAKSKIINVENYKLATLAKVFKADTTGAHRAVNDCAMTLQVYLYCLTIPNGKVFDPKKSARGTLISQQIRGTFYLIIFAFLILWILYSVFK